MTADEKQEIMIEVHQKYVMPFAKAVKILTQTVSRYIDFLPALKCGDSFCKTVKPDRKPKIVATARTTHRTS
mgnify:CR=1 FL=1